MNLTRTNTIMKIIIVITFLFVQAFVVNVNGQLLDDECIRRVINYDIQQDSRILSFQVLVDSVSGGTVKLRVFPMQESGYRSPISNSALDAIRRGESLQKIYRRDKTVALLVTFERKVSRLSGVSSILWTADERCSPGFVCVITGATLTPDYVAPCLDRTSKKNDSNFQVTKRDSNTLDAALANLIRDTLRSQGLEKAEVEAFRSESGRYRFIIGKAVSRQSELKPVTAQINKYLYEIGVKRNIIWEVCIKHHLDFDEKKPEVGCDGETPLGKTCATIGGKWTCFDN